MTSSRALYLGLVLVASACDAIPVVRPDAGFTDRTFKAGCLIYPRDPGQLVPRPPAGVDTWDNFAQGTFAGFCLQCHSSTLTGAARHGAIEGGFCPPGQVVCCNPLSPDFTPRHPRVCSPPTALCTPEVDGGVPADPDAGPPACAASLPVAQRDYSWDNVDSVTRHLVEIRTVVVENNYMPFQDTTVPPEQRARKLPCDTRIRLAAWIDDGAPIHTP